MPHLAVPRKGWENEHLATFLLSRIAFVAHPVTVADDIGSDFFCTLFEPRDQDGTEMLFPLNSFAIQVKSSLGDVPATNKIEYFLKLELPFFIGVVDRSGLCLSLYSGEYLPIMFSHLGRPGQLTMCPVDQEVDGVASAPYDSTPGGACNLRLPVVLKLAAGDDRETLSTIAQKLSQLCSRMHGNISTWKLDEYIFKLGPAGQVEIMAGSGSAQTFRHNFYLRLAEVFYNLEWLLQNRSHDFSAAEFEMYERLYNDLLKSPHDIPSLLPDVYARLRKLVVTFLSGLPNSREPGLVAFPNVGFCLATIPRLVHNANQPWLPI